MYSSTFGEIDLNNIAEIIVNSIIVNRDSKYEILIGSDSQTYKNRSKLVSVIVLRRIGKGAIFFYDNKIIEPCYKTIRQKLVAETSSSLELANNLLKCIEDIGKDDVLDKVNIKIHVDAGEMGPTKLLINEVIGWIEACGYHCKIKPYSYAASSVADKLSK